MFGLGIYCVIIATVALINKPASGIETTWEIIMHLVAEGLLIFGCVLTHRGLKKLK